MKNDTRLKPYRKYGIDDFKEAIKGCMGNKSLIRRRLGCSSQTLYVYLRRYPELEELVKLEREIYKDELIDIARLKLRSALLEGRPYAVCLVLRTLGSMDGFHTSPDSKRDNSDSPYVLNVTCGTELQKVSTVESHNKRAYKTLKP